jgi:hypothetical protein
VIDREVGRRMLVALRLDLEDPAVLAATLQKLQSELPDASLAGARPPLPKDEAARATTIVRRLVDAGVVDETTGRRSIEKILEAGDDLRRRYDPAWPARVTLHEAGMSVRLFDREGIDVPPAHDELVHALAAVSDGAFRPEAVYQSRSEFEEGYFGRCPVQFVHAGRLYRTWVPDWGDWLDDDSVLAAANAALGDLAGERRRFVSIAPDRQCSEPVFVVWEQLAAVAGAVGLTMREIEGIEVMRTSWLGHPLAAHLWETLIELEPNLADWLPESSFARATGPCGETPLHTAAERGAPLMAEALIDAGAEVNAVDDHGVTPLHRAMESFGSPVGLLLLQRGADVRARDREGRTPLHWASREDLIEMVGPLIDHGADMEATDDDARTPLHVAAIKGSLDAASALIAAGANPKACDLVGLTPDDLAIRNGNGQFASLLAQQTPGERPKPPPGP